MKRAYEGVYELENYAKDSDSDESGDTRTLVEDRGPHAIKGLPADQLGRQDQIKNDDESTVQKWDLSTLTRMEDVHIGTPTDEEEQQDEPVSRSIVVSLMDPPNGRSTCVVDLRTGDPRPPLQPKFLDRDTDKDLYDFLDVASRNCRYRIWYDLVTSYTGRDLTKSSDKLPAIAGLAATIHKISQDSYFAGHWRVELERSLFWRSDQDVMPWSPEPARCRDYRAPSWAWPSEDGRVYWKWPDLSPGVEEEAPLKIVDVGVELIAGVDNPFGPVADGTLTVEGRTTWVRWDECANAYITSGLGDASAETVDSGKTTPMLHIRNGRGKRVGSWGCDNTLNTVLPATKITPGITLEELTERIISFCGYARWPTKASNTTDLEERFTALPPELLCLRGPTKYKQERDRANNSDGNEEEVKLATSYSVETLLLARTEDPSGKVFRRVGAAAFCSWDESEETVETIIII